ncbi:XRE family transcriptional regulator [Actinopolyspora erythraea]|uniref:XRE family transcriptional regulator n=1 Tax=Actinopolyspora erythraea TaxID=414996 RepID=A0A223RVR6_9ACTN|nr:helix-turn-helix transcriptional regulator [Actinopolyspora erythraea]ASU79958.1 XRE family transcriptional regulator [Actinopolyspora erythraea]
METFGQALRRLRALAGLSQPQLARQAHISQSSLSRYESDRQTVDVSMARRLDELLGSDGELTTLAAPTSGLLTPDDQQRLARGLERPYRIDAATVTALADMLAAQRKLDDTLGPEPLIPAVMAQMDTVLGLMRQASGRHQHSLAEVGAEYVQFAGWLHAETRRDRDAVRLLSEAEQVADEIGNGVLAAQAANFKGYLARQQGNSLGIVRWFLAEHHTPGAHIAQRVGAAAQAAQGYAELGQPDNALRLLDTAGELIDAAAREEPPRTAYWLTPTFHRLNIGLAHLALGDHTTASDHLSAGLDGLPPDQRTGEWTVEYREALDRANQYR